MLLHGQNAVPVVSTSPQNFYQCTMWLIYLYTVHKTGAAAAAQNLTKPTPKPQFYGLYKLRKKRASHSKLF